MNMSENIVDEEKHGDTNNNDDGSEQSGNPMDGQICRDYQRGVCNRGGKCKFNHPDGQGKEIESGPMICRDFQNGKCNRATCKYLHISNTEEKVYLRTGQLPMRRPPPPGPPGPPRGDYGGYLNTRANRSDPICKDFLNSKCTRGTACKFRHAYEDDAPSGYGGHSGYDDFPRKRRRESFGDSDFAHVKEENESLRRQIADLQKQVSDLKATNEVLLEQNARYRNQAASTTSYPSTPSYPSNYSSSKPTSAPPPTSYSTSYPSTYNGSTTYTTASTYTYTTDNAAYTSTGTTNYGATTSDTSIYSSSYPSGTGYIKFE